MLIPTIRRNPYFCVIILSVGILLSCVPGLAQTSRLSVSTGGLDGDGNSGAPDITPDGRYVAFDSDAGNLVTDDENNRDDVFMRDRVDGTTTRVSLADDENESNGHCYEPAMSADGRYVAFSSDANNLLGTGNDTNGVTDVFVRDRLNGTTERVSVRNGGAQTDDHSSTPVISQDGRNVVFESSDDDITANDTNNDQDIFLRDRIGGSVELISLNTDGVQPDDWSFDPAINADGSLVAFASHATELAGGDTGWDSDVFVRDRISATTTHVSVTSAGLEGAGDSGHPSLSPDGRYVAFESLADNLVSNDANNRSDVFLHDRLTATTIRISVGPGGVEANGASYRPKFSADGRYVAFRSRASNLVANNSYGDTMDVYVYDIQTGGVTKVNVATDGTQDNHPDTDNPQFAIASGGAVVAFSSAGTNLIAADTNEHTDIFAAVDQCLADSTKLVPGACGCGVADTDSDDDGLPDCSDQCPNGPNVDQNGNGTLDCLDPNGDTIPDTAVVTVSKKTAKVSIQLHSFPGSGLTYRVEIKQGSRVVKRLNTKSSSITLRGLKPGRYSIIYDIVLAGKRTQLSAVKSFVVKAPKPKKKK